MGKITNLIADMQIKHASEDEVVAAVRHSMVVIDAYKHGLDYKLSAEDNNIKSLRIKYQNKAGGGASTLLTKAAGRQDVDPRAVITPNKETGERQYRKLKTIWTDPKTGEVKIIEPASYMKLRNTDRPKLDAKGRPLTNKKGEIIYEKEPVLDKNGDPVWIKKTMTSTKMMETDDARTLSSGEEIEEIYAAHANDMKALANAARRVGYQNTPFNHTVEAEKVYADEVESLTMNLRKAMANAPMERTAMSVATAMVRDKKLENPDMDDDQIKKYRGIALTIARDKVGAAKEPIYISDREWDAIQNGAVNKTTLRKILQNADSTRVKELATPRTNAAASEYLINRIQGLASGPNGLTAAQIAARVGLSVSTVNSYINS